jgi:Na+-translocating ferredoxin:NAD+ oxidoreductase RnfD subunit
MTPGEKLAAAPASHKRQRFFPIESPYLHAPETARTVYTITFLAACVPVLAGLAFFGWAAAFVTVLSVTTCVIVERIFYRVARTPALLGRSHAYLTGILLAATLPPFVPWYVPVIAGAFAIILGKAVFGGVGHFLWQPALVGRLAVAVMFPVLLTPQTWPLLGQTQLVRGDIHNAKAPQTYRRWADAQPPDDADAFALARPVDVLKKLYDTEQPAFSGIAYVPGELDRAPPTLTDALPPINDLLYGATPGAIGETCAVLILVAGLYLIYRNYVTGHLPVAMLAGAAIVAAIAPVHLAGPAGQPRIVWYPFFHEGTPVGFLFVLYHLLSGGMLLAAFFLAPEMTSRPVTRGGQVLFGLGCGAAAMLLRIYTTLPIPTYTAVLAMNTLTPTIDALWRPRVMGQKWYERFLLLRPRPRADAE